MFQKGGIHIVLFKMKKMGEKSDEVIFDPRISFFKINL